MRKWLVVLSILAAARWAEAEPIRLARFAHRGQAAPAREGAVVQARDGGRLEELMRNQLLAFIQVNYPAHLSAAAKSLQTGEGRLSGELTRAVRVLQELALGPVTIGGDLRPVRGTPHYVLTGMIHGVRGHPNATVRLETRPGPRRPVTEVELDADGDGNPERADSGFSRWEDVWGWLERNLLGLAGHQPRTNFVSRSRRDG